MSKNINIISEDVCTGCGACNNCCPVDAIEMLEDQEGFKYPNIDMDKCISCGKCINVCPEANVERINQIYMKNRNVMRRWQIQLLE